MRRLVAVVVAVAASIPAASCSTTHHASGAPTTTAPTGAAGVTVAPASETEGLIAPAVWKARQADYLAFATAQPVNGGSPLSLLAHAGAAQLAGQRPDLSAATVASLTPMFAKLKSYADTGDFDINELLTLWLRERTDLNPSVAAAIRTRILAFKYWWTEPTPKGIVDSQYYWTENHQIIYLADEYIAGQTFPDRVFTNSGMTGREHMDHASDRLTKWFAWRARFGFSEWLSNVYWSEDMKGLLLLAEFAQDPQIARTASMMLDVLFVELASHVQKGTFGATHGRSYQKDKLSGADEDTFSTAKLVFDQTPAPYPNADNATLLAIARNYRPPEVVRRIAASTSPSVIRQRAGIPLDPTAPVNPSAQAPYGLPFTGEDGLMIWWGMGAQFPWQVAPLSVDTVKQHDLFKTTNFKQAAALAPIIAKADTATIRTLARSLAKQVNPGLLSQVDTYTWRSPGVMLSTAQDWRPGQRGEQDHIWQATLDPDALVFTQHPRDPVPSASDPNAHEGYWTGDGAMPRAGQWKNVNISIYAPQYPGGSGVGSGAYSFSYQPYTHAYFPTEKFDQVVQQGGWTIGRRGSGFVALWSQRPTIWRQYDPKTEFTHGLTKPFDLVAPGGPDNVWITEVADSSAYAAAGPSTPARFLAFVAAITKAKVNVRSASCPSGYVKCPPPAAGAGAYVAYDSPSQGAIDFGWAPQQRGIVPFSVDGRAVALHPNTFRWSSPWATAAWDTGIYHAAVGTATLDLDFNTVTRRTSR